MNTFLRLTNKTRQEFTKANNELFSKLDYEPNKLFIKGSFIQPVLSLFASDIDLYEPVSMSDFDKFYTYLRKLIKENKSMIEFIEIYDTFKGLPNKFLQIKKEDLEKMLKEQEGRIHIELAYFEDGLIQNISIMYDLKSKINMKTDKVIESLYEVIDSKVKKNIFKGLKRLYSMLILLPETRERIKKINLVKTILSNPLYGSLYLAINHLTAIKDTHLFQIQVKNQSLQTIKGLVRRTGQLTESMIPKFSRFSKKNTKLLINNLRQILNRKIKEDKNFKMLKL